MSRIDRAIRRRLERRQKRRTLKLGAELEHLNGSPNARLVAGHGWAIHKRGQSLQWQKADGLTIPNDD